MEKQYYEDANDFFELFDGDSFDKEELVGRTWRGCWADDTTLVIAAEFVYDCDEHTSGTGWAT